MKIYGHLRETYSQALAKTVSFLEVKQAGNPMGIKPQGGNEPV